MRTTAAVDGGETSWRNFTYEELVAATDGFSHWWVYSPGKSFFFWDCRLIPVENSRADNVL
ncbi:hypothetical protein Hdeb2414_s0115g00800251 [Helianthus debilis subsp. tardiflorus]